MYSGSCRGVKASISGFKINIWRSILIGALRVSRGIRKVVQKRSSGKNGWVVDGICTSNNQVLLKGKKWN